MESPCAGSWLSSTRLYMIIRASAGYGWVTSCVRTFVCCYYQTSLLCDAGRWHFPLCDPRPLLQCEECVASNTMSWLPVHAHTQQGRHILGRVWLNHYSSWLFCMFIFLWQKMEAAYYDNIIEQQRIEPEFFRMGFYGRKFPFFLRVGLNPVSSCLSWCSYESADEISCTAPSWSSGRQRRLQQLVWDKVPGVEVRMRLKWICILAESKAESIPVYLYVF